MEVERHGVDFLWDIMGEWIAQYKPRVSLHHLRALVELLSKPAYGDWIAYKYCGDWHTAIYDAKWEELLRDENISHIRVLDKSK